MAYNYNQRETNVRAFGKRDDRRDDRQEIRDTDLEADVLGAIMRSGDTAKFILSLDQSCFSDNAHKLLFQMIDDAVKNGKRTVSSAALAAMATSSALQAFGGREILDNVASRGVNAEGDIPEMIAALRSLACRREAVAAAHELIAMMSRGDVSPEEAMSQCSRRLTSCVTTGNQFLSKREAASRAIDERIAMPAPITSGIRALDPLIMGGLRPRTFIVFEGAYAVGKSATLATIGDNVNAQGISNLYITLESTIEELELRSAARRMKLKTSWTFDRNHDGYEKLCRNRDAYVSAIPDNTRYMAMRRPTIDMLRREIIRAKLLYGVKVVLLDYLQCIGGFERGMKEETFWYDIGEALRDLAKEEDICIVAAAQDQQKTALSLRQTSTLLVKIEREANDEVMHYTIEKTNDSAYGTTRKGSTPSIILDPAGPHVRDAEQSDLIRLAHGGDSGGDMGDAAPGGNEPAA